MVAKGIYATRTLNNKTECCSGTILKIHNMNEKNVFMLLKDYSGLNFDTTEHIWLQED